MLVIFGPKRRRAYQGAPSDAAGCCGAYLWLSEYT
jgi:hypothetical protein